MGITQYGAGLWMFGQFIDRYATDAYGPPVSTLEAIDRAGQVGRLSCVDINIPFTDASISVADVRSALDANGLTAAAITPAIYIRRFQKGSFTNPDPVVRSEAVALGKRAIEVAVELNAGYVKFWPGQDGHDYRTSVLLPWSTTRSDPPNCPRSPRSFPTGSSTWASPSRTWSVLGPGWPTAA